MKRLTMSLDDDLADAFEALVRERGYENRSEAFRDLLNQPESKKRAASLDGLAALPTDWIEGQVDALAQRILTYHGPSLCGAVTVSQSVEDRRVCDNAYHRQVIVTFDIRK